MMVRRLLASLLLTACAAELELFKEIQHGRGVDEDNDPYVRDNVVALSGSKLVVASYSTMGRPGQVALFDAWTGDKLRDIFRCEYDVIQAVALWDTTLAIVGFGDSVTLFDTTTGERLREFGSTGWAADFSPDGRKLAVGEDDVTTVYDVATGEVLSEFVNNGRPDFNPVGSVAFSPDGALLATGSFDGKIYIYDVETEEQRVEIDVQSSIYSLAWAPDSSVLAGPSPVIYEDGIIFPQASAATYDPMTGAVVKTFEIEGLDYVAFSPDGATLAASGGYDFNGDSKVVIFDVASGDVVQTIEKGSVDVTGFDYSPDGTLALGEEGGASLYREAGAPVPSTPAPTAVSLAYAQVAEIQRRNGGGALPKKIAFSPDGNIAVGDAWPVAIYDGFTGDVVREVTDREDGSIETVAYSPDGKTLAVGFSGLTVQNRLSVYDAETGDLRKEIPFDYVRIARFSPDGSTLAAGGGFSNGGVGDVTIFDAASLDVLKELDMGDRPWTRTIAYSPSGSELVVQSGWETLGIYAVSSGELLKTISVASQDSEKSPLIYDVAFAYDATLAIIKTDDLFSDEDPTVVFFDESFEESGELTPGGRASTLAFSPRADGLLAVGGAKVELFDYASKTLVREFERCSPFVDEMAFSQDGALLAVAARSTSDYPNGRVAIYLRSSDDAPMPRPTPMPTSRPTFRPTSSPRDESDGARTVSMAWAALLLVAWLA